MFSLMRSVLTSTVYLLNNILIKDKVRLNLRMTNSSTVINNNCLTVWPVAHINHEHSSVVFPLYASPI